jgi:integrase
MARPKNKDGIRARGRATDGFQLVHFDEYPGHWIATPETDREKAIKWAKRNREWLVNRRTETFAHYCQGFFSPESLWVRKMKKKGHHFIDKYLLTRQGHLDLYAVPEFGDVRPGDIKRLEIDDWLLDLKTKAGRELAGETKNKIMYSMGLVFEHLKDVGVIQESPIQGIRAYDKTPVKPRGVIPRESLAKLYPPAHGAMVRVWGSAMWAALMLVLNDTGGRPGEVRALTWSDIDVQRRFIPIRKGVESGTASKIKGTKNDLAKAGFLSPRTIQELNIWQTESRHVLKTDFVFTINGDAPVTGAAIIKAFRRGLKAVGIDNKDWTPYWLRHSFGTYQMEILDDEEIAALLGHGVTVLRKSYQHPDNDTLYAANKDLQNKLDKARG